MVLMCFLVSLFMYSDLCAGFHFLLLCNRNWTLQLCSLCISILCLKYYLLLISVSFLLPHCLLPVLYSVIFISSFTNSVFYFRPFFWFVLIASFMRVFPFHLSLLSRGPVDQCTFQKPLSVYLVVLQVHIWFVYTVHYCFSSFVSPLRMPHIVWLSV